MYQTGLNFGEPLKPELQTMIITSGTETIFYRSDLLGHVRLVRPNGIKSTCHRKSPLRLLFCRLTGHQPDRVPLPTLLTGYPHAHPLRARLDKDITRFIAQTAVVLRLALSLQ